MSEPMALPAGARRRRLRPLLGSISYVKRNRARCFICAIVDHDPDYRHHVVHEDAQTVAFLAKGTTFWGHTLVCPKDHRERVVDDFTEAEYLKLQATVHLVGCAVARSVPCERLYVLSIGSQQLNRHVHWHITPLPPGVALPRQQLRAFSPIVTGELDVPATDLDRLAECIRVELSAQASG